MNRTLKIASLLAAVIGVGALAGCSADVQYTPGYTGAPTDVGPYNTYYPYEYYDAYPYDWPGHFWSGRPEHRDHDRDRDRGREREHKRSRGGERHERR